MTIGEDDAGRDIYEINLKNGWILDEMVREDRILTSGEETLDSVTLNKGATSQ